MKSANIVVMGRCRQISDDGRGPIRPQSAGGRGSWKPM